MSFDEQIRPAFNNLEARLRRDVARHLDAAIEELHEQAQKISEATELRQASLVAEAARHARLEAEEIAQLNLAAALAEAERVSAEKSALQSEATERTINERVAAAVLDVERSTSEHLSAVVADAERAAADRMQRVLDEAARAAANAEREAEERLQMLLREADQTAETRLHTLLRTAEQKSDERLQTLLTEAGQKAEERVSAAQSLAASEALGRAQDTFRRLELAAGQRLAAAFRSIDAAQSLSDILAALASAAAAEVPRVALLLASEREIRSWRFLGFEPTLGAEDSLAFPPADAGIVAEAYAQRQPIAMGLEQAGTAPVFAELPAGRQALAVPVVVNGEVVAVVYADEGVEGGNERAAWPSVVEVLARHAARALEAVTAYRLARTLTDRRSAAAPRPVPAPVVAAAPVAPTAVAVVAPMPAPVAATEHPIEPRLATVVPLSPPRPSLVPPPAPVAPGEVEHAAAKAYAQELVSGIRFRNEAQVIAALRDGDLMGRLGSEIARAWSLYEARVPQAIRTNTNYFHSEMVRTLADGDASLLSPTL